MSRPYTTQDTLPLGRDDNRPVRAMHQLPHQQARASRDALLARAPKRLRRAILDTDFFRRRSGHTERENTQADIQEFYNRVAYEGAESTQPGASALFWCLGVRHRLRASTLSRNPMERLKQLRDSDPLQGGPSKAPLSYRAMALRACRYVPPQPEIYEICLQICYEVRRFGEWRKTTCSFPSAKTQAWISWVGISRGENFKIPRPAMGTMQFHRNRWEAEGITPEHALGLLKAYESLSAQTPRDCEAFAARRKRYEKASRGNLPRSSSEQTRTSDGKSEK